MNKAVAALIVLVVLPVSLQAAPPTLILLSNSIDYSLAQDFISYLQDKGYEVRRIEAGDFQQYREEKLIVILGGPDAPEGVGPVVQDILSPDEQTYLRTPGNKAMYVKSKWAPDQQIFIIAGSDRNKTAEAHLVNREKLYKNVTVSSEVKLTIPSPLPSGSLIIYSGEYTEQISYWGFVKKDGYTTVKLQGVYHTMTTGSKKVGNTTVYTYKNYPYITVTFRDTELPVRFLLDGVEYEILYYDAEKIIVKK